ncbi:hypothetical protein EV360DRAFT_90568 [Lentinula raphanica]|nr:hypothetical protein EV360DRAFT_90568 [Lentinula raphanica]
MVTISEGAPATTPLYDTWSPHDDNEDDDDNDQDTEHYPSRSFIAVWNFMRNRRTVQLIAVKRSVVEAILGFHSTCVMNIITHRTAYCLFAKSTLIDRNSFTFNNSLTDAHSLPIRHKWMNRGFNVVHCPSPHDLVNFSSGMTIRHYRWVGDSACLKIALEENPIFDKIDKIDTIDAIESDSWKIHYRKTHTTIKSTFFQPDPEQPGIVVSREERRILTRKYDMLKSSVEQQLQSLDYAIFSCQSCQPSRSIHWERNAVVGSIIRDIMRSVNYQPPYSPLQAATLLQDFYDFLTKIHLDHKNVALKRAEIYQDEATHRLVVVTLWIDPAPKPINISVYNKCLLSFSARGLYIQFVWPIGSRVRSVS